MAALNFSNRVTNLYKPLYYFALSLTFNRERAEDLTQETMLKAIKYEEKYQDNTNLKAWLYTILKNTFINEYRKITKTQTLFTAEETEFVLNNKIDSKHQSAEGMIIEKDIYSCISSLDSCYKEPFEMFIEGYKYKEIAKELDLPLGTVKSRIFFTRKQLEEKLSDYNDRK